MDLRNSRIKNFYTRDILKNYIIKEHVWETTVSWKSTQYFKLAIPELWRCKAASWQFYFANYPTQWGFTCDQTWSSHSKELSTVTAAGESNALPVDATDSE